MTKQLRPYQKDAKDQIAKAWGEGHQNVCFVCPTGGGKTLTLSSIVHDFNEPTCVIAHRQELVSQLSLALAGEGVIHRIIGPKNVVQSCVKLHMMQYGRSFYDPSAKCGVAGVDTIIRRTEQLERWIPQVKLWVTDECFPAGTLVDGKPIETIQVGDYVTAYNEELQRFEQRKVVRLFKNPTPSRLVRVTLGDRVIDSTPNHPYYTKRGWIPAMFLQEDDRLLEYCKNRKSRWRRMWRRVTSLPPHGDGFVYNIEVEGLHNYVANGVLVHNCHHLLEGNKWGKAASMFPNAKGLGVTATPLRADGCGLGRHAEGVFDTMVLGPSMRYLIDSGYLTDYRIFAPPSDLDLAKVKISQTTGDYSQHDLVEATRKSHIMGDVVSQYLKIAKGKRALVFATDVKSAKEIAEQFTASGVPAVAIDAKTPDLERFALLAKFKSGEILVVVNVDLFGEGTDIPAVEVVIMARATQSYGLYVQVFGRALRLMEGKSHAIIIDHVGNVIRHGLPDAPRQWTLDGMERRAKSTDPDVIPVKACPMCSAVYERFYAACPHCQYKPVPQGRVLPEMVDGDLCEITPDVLEQLRSAIERVDRSEASVRDEMIAKHTPEVGVRSAVKRHREMQAAQSALRESIAWWAGYRNALGMSDSEAYRRFYLRYGMDVMTAQTLGTAEADELRIKIEEDLLG